MLEFYKASPLKRIAAYVIDLILLLIITASVVAGMFSSMNFGSYRDELLNCYEKYGQEYGVDLSDSRENYTEEELQKYNAALDAMNTDKEALAILGNMVKITLLSLIVGLFVAYLILEVMLPLIFGNGQTVGKKVTGLCVMHKDHVRVSKMQVIYRAILGKYFVETAIPVTMLVLRFAGTLGTTAGLVLALIAMTQGFIVLMSQANCGIHDKLFKTVVADYTQQHIFDTIDERIAYEEAYEKEMAEREAKYGE